MGVKLLPPRLYRSELANRESLRDTLLLVELDTEKKNHKQSTFRTQNLNLTQDHFPLQAARCLATDQKSRNPQEQSPGQRQEIRRCC